MNYEQAQTVFQCASYLLSYPDDEWARDLDGCLQALDDLPHRQIVGYIEQFINHIKAVPVRERIETYVYTFDFGKKTNLYVTYMNTGEQRERGLELLELKQQYKAAGFDITEKELPDYLPLMLELASQAEPQHVVPIFQKYWRNIEEIRNQLHANDNVYTVVFDAILTALNEIGVKSLPKGSV
ncbi:nitrate reductase delta subunit [Anoxybacillus voinovskiensis]|uniref:Nitrate reductase delta subunit n=1 Tax=Anoxybacteroides voinovskiense TaxID=230470 RepID=A0A840DKX5_9BACL|nr:MULTISPECIES: nitrate reductase molybdenum cofactor assembly chaperone [Anoxybacillus]MBB4072355.1 nitrate reductase delta subunit [Anoxybacillus voinovskiensis]MCL6587657.1 nitrate reductase molybdenum cofactor assembly chaperone [Anoxybacillus sp.]GGJ58531.1 putative nitrate reductase molybdenum cofactor assembly chaperone NarJ [Anoxybacillus voinovskiensis]